MSTRTYTKTHVLVGFTNPYLVCEECREKVPFWHDPDRCGCNGETFNSPCKHKLGVVSTCPTWSPGHGCICEGETSCNK